MPKLTVPCVGTPTHSLRLRNDRGQPRIKQGLREALMLVPTVTTESCTRQLQTADDDTNLTTMRYFLPSRFRHPYNGSRAPFPTKK